LGHPIGILDLKLHSLHWTLEKVLCKHADEFK